MNKISQRAKTFFSEKLLERQQRSAQYQAQYEETGGPSVINNFLRASPNALKEPWVQRAIVQAMQEGDTEFLKKSLATISNKRRHKMQNTAIKSLMTVIEVDKLYESGRYKNKNEVFKEIAKAEWSWSYDVTKNRYYRWRKKEPDIFVEQNEDYILISAFPAKISMGDKCFPGRWEVKIYHDNRPTKLAWTIYQPSDYQK